MICKFASQELGDFKLYGRVDLQPMLVFLDCDPVDSSSSESGVSINPELPAWSKSSRPLDQLLRRGGTNVKVSGPGTGTGGSLRTLGNTVPQAGKFEPENSAQTQLRFCNVNVTFAATFFEAIFSLT